ncbi:HEAT repeat domain-containing protein [Candidatus Woesearchaeota archaeon]|nr:HEAT repeat domain-containing protein [Candidatus Woesearchaeota archaeon]
MKKVISVLLIFVLLLSSVSADCLTPLGKERLVEQKTPELVEQGLSKEQADTLLRSVVEGQKELPATELTYQQKIDEVQGLIDREEFDAAVARLNEYGISIPRFDTSTGEALDTPEKQARGALRLEAEKRRPIVEKQVDEAIEKLASSSTSTRIEGSNALKSIGKEAVPKLIEALDNDNPDIRWQAARSLGDIGDERAIPKLIEKLSDKDTTLQSNVIVALGRLKAYDAVYALNKIAFDKYKASYLRRNAITALGEIVGPRADEVNKKLGDTIGVLTKALTDKDPQIREAAAKASGLIGNADPLQISRLIGLQQDKNEYVRDSASEALSRIREKMISNMNSDDAKVRRASIDIIEVFNDPTLVPVLIDALNDADSNVVTYAMKALAKYKDNRAVLPLIDKLDKGNDFERSVAARTLGQIGGAQAVPALSNALRDADAFVRREAANALGLIRDKSASSSLIEALTDTDVDVRANVVEALGRVFYDSQDQTVSEALVQSLSDSDARIRRMSAEALGRIGDTEIVPGLIEARNDNEASVQDAALKALALLGNQDAINEFIQDLKSDSSEKRINAINILEETGKGINEILNSEALFEDENTQRYAVIAVMRNGNANDLIRLMNIIKSTTNPKTKANLIEAMTGSTISQADRILGLDNFEQLPPLFKEFLKKGEIQGEEMGLVIGNLPSVATEGIERSSLESRIEQELSGLSFTSRTAGDRSFEDDTFTGQKHKLSSSDLIKILQIVHSLKNPNFRNSIGKNIVYDLEHYGSELGGLAFINEDGELELEDFAPKCRGDNCAYVSSETRRLKANEAFFDWHQHATGDANPERYVGPSGSTEGGADLGVARRDRHDGVVIAYLGGNKFNLHFYTPEGYVVNLGNYEWDSDNVGVIDIDAIRAYYEVAQRGYDKNPAAASEITSRSELSRKQQADYLKAVVDRNVDEEGLRKEMENDGIPNAADVARAVFTAEAPSKAEEAALAQESPLRDLVGDNLPITTPAFEKMPSTPLGFEPLDVSDVEQPTAEFRDKIWGGDTLAIPITSPTEYRKNLAAPLVTDSENLAEGGLQYKPGDKITLVRYIRVDKATAEAIKGSKRVLSQEVAKQQGDISKAEEEFNALTGKDLTLESLLQHTWDIGRRGNLGISTTYDPGILLADSTTDDCCIVKYTIEVPAERVVKVGGTVENPVFPAGFDLRRGDVKNFGFVNPSNYESEITFLYEVPNEYVSRIDVIEDSPQSLVNMIESDAFVTEHKLQQIKKSSLFSSQQKSELESIQDPVERLMRAREMLLGRAEVPADLEERVNQRLERYGQPVTETVRQNELQQEQMIDEIAKEIESLCEGICGKPIIIEGGAGLSTDYLPGVSDRDISIFVDGLTLEQKANLDNIINRLRLKYPGEQVSFFIYNTDLLKGGTEQTIASSEEPYPLARNWIWANTFRTARVLYGQAEFDRIAAAPLSELSQKVPLNAEDGESYRIGMTESFIEKLKAYREQGLQVDLHKTAKAGLRAVLGRVMRDNFDVVKGALGAPDASTKSETNFILDVARNSGLFNEQEMDLIRKMADLRLNPQRGITNAEVDVLEDFVFKQALVTERPTIEVTQDIKDFWANADENQFRANWQDLPADAMEEAIKNPERRVDILLEYYPASQIMMGGTVAPSQSLADQQFSEQVEHIIEAATRSSRINDIHVHLSQALPVEMLKDIMDVVLQGDEWSQNEKDEAVKKFAAYLGRQWKSAYEEIWFGSIQQQSEEIQRRLENILQSLSKLEQGYDQSVWNNFWTEIQLLLPLLDLSSMENYQQRNDEMVNRLYIAANDQFKAGTKNIAGDIIPRIASRAKGYFEIRHAIQGTDPKDLDNMLKRFSDADISEDEAGFILSFTRRSIGSLKGKSIPLVSIMARLESLDQISALLEQVTSKNDLMGIYRVLSYAQRDSDTEKAIEQMTDDSQEIERLKGMIRNKQINRIENNQASKKKINDFLERFNKYFVGIDITGHEEFPFAGYDGVYDISQDLDVLEALENNDKIGTTVHAGENFRRRSIESAIRQVYQVAEHADRIGHGLAAVVDLESIVESDQEIEDKLIDPKEIVETSTSGITSFSVENIFESGHRFESLDQRLKQLEFEKSHINEMNHYYSNEGVQQLNTEDIDNEIVVLNKIIEASKRITSDDITDESRRMKDEVKQALSGREELMPLIDKIMGEPPTFKIQRISKDGIITRSLLLKRPYITEDNELDIDAKKRIDALQKMTIDKMIENEVVLELNPSSNDEIHKVGWLHYGRLFTYTYSGTKPEFQGKKLRVTINTDTEATLESTIEDEHREVLRNLLRSYDSRIDKLRAELAQTKDGSERQLAIRHEIVMLENQQDIIASALRDEPEAIIDFIMPSSSAIALSPAKRGMIESATS